MTPSVASSNIFNGYKRTVSLVWESMDEEHTHEEEVEETKRTVKWSIVLIILLILLIIGVSWILTRGVDDDTNVPAVPTQNPTNVVPSEPSNPNVTGGSSGAGTGQTNDPNTGTPSPAGGVDTNGN